MTGRIAVGVSGTGSNLQALHAAAVRGELGGTIALVFADRPCPALDWAKAQGLEIALVLRGSDPELGATLHASGAEVVALAGYMRVIGPEVLAAFAGRVVNTHPSLLPGFPGAHAVRDALAAGVKVTGATVHLVDEVIDGGPVLLQEAVPIQPGDTEETLHARIKTVEHRLLPWAVALLLAGAVTLDGPVATIDAARAARIVPRPRRALLSVSDKTGIVPFAEGLANAGFELVSTGGTARTLRDAGLPVTDVSAVTGFPEMLDGRVKTLHPRVHAGVLADLRNDDHREQLAAAAIAPFELVVVNLYPFAAAAERPGISLDELIEEIDIGGPGLIRAAAKNSANVTVVTSPGRYDSVLQELASQDARATVAPGLRGALAVEAFRHTAAYDARIANELPCAMDGAGIPLPDEPGLPRSTDQYPDSLTVALEKVETLRYGENPHQLAARYVRVGRGAERGPFASREEPLQGKALSYNNVLDATAAASLARSLRGPACVIVKHTNPCGAAERTGLLEAWDAALAGDPVSAFGGVVGLTREVDEPVARALTSLFLEVVVAPGYDDEARAVLASKPNLRLIVDPSLGAGNAEGWPSNTGSIRTSGGAVLVSTPDTRHDDPAGWAVLSSRPPSAEERRDLDLAWRLVRGATSNAIVLVRDGRLIGLGSGQTSRVDAARQAVEKARAISGGEVLRGASCASDAFFPFPDAVEACLEAGISAFVQPGGSIRDAEILTAVENAGAAMLITGTRHFRH
ncbi:MAG: bifunctional phosphoribosylaminoimidazolecarboxamide formyltransferase/IMP cyclohydrolase [Chloroflexi bacterium]|nr:MAG: bifunctional phosphoribosylaminoimidazolecarboxamide formyltransferase/IMP cyclohydrolase [Chloroflexota bacterium]